jgi:hypothetical protein
VHESRAAERMLDGAEVMLSSPTRPMTASRSTKPSRIIAVAKTMDWIEGNKPN